MTTAGEQLGVGHTTKADTAFAVGVAVLFACVCGFAISYHEMWPDELQAWLIARSSSTLGELRDAMRYEGHPALWYLLLYGVTRLTQRAEAMQLLHVVIGSACAFVFARSAPFPRWARLCFVLSYYPIYEYGVISRNYSIGILFLFLAATLLPRRHERPWLLGFFLALAAQTNAMALIVAAAFAGTVFLEPWVSRGPRAGVTSAWKTLGVTGAGILLAAIYVTPPADTGYADVWVLEPNRLRAEAILGHFARAVVPISSRRESWGDLWQAGTHHLAPSVAVLLLACLLPWLLRRRVALVMVAAGTAALLLFFYIKLNGSLRHHGFLFINLVLACWYAEMVRRESVALPGVATPSDTVDRTFALLASSVLIVQLGLAGIAVRRDVVSVFSGGRATAELLVENDLDELPVVADPDGFMTPVLGYLHQRTFYYPRTRRFGSFVRYDQARLGVELTDDQLVAAARDLGQANQSPVALVITHRLDPTVADAVDEIGCVSADLTEPETYCVYRLPAPSSRE